MALMSGLGRRTAMTASLVALLALVSTSLQAQQAQQAQAQDGQAQNDQPPAESDGPPLAPLQAEDTPAFDTADVSATVFPLLADPALGPTPSAIVLDAATGETLVDLRSSTPLVPASSLKIATGLAALTALGPDAQLRTEVLRDVDGSLVLIGGGDPTLLTAYSGEAPTYPRPATLADLADRTAAVLIDTAVPQVALRFDNSLFTGPALSPDWDSTFVASGIVSPVSALTVDPASPQVDGAALDADPAGTVAAWFAARLQARGIAVTSVAPGTASAQADPVASVSSPPISAIVDRMLDISDNDVAEALFRLAAIGRGLPSNFEGGASAVTATLQELGAPSAGLVVRDGSGLSRSNRIAPVTLAHALRLATDPDLVQEQSRDAAAPGAESITWLPSGLPVAGLTGSLADRFGTPQTDPGAGRVHAKTGTLTGVTSLSGLVATDQQRPVVFAVLSDQTPNTVAAREALDRFAAALADCGCVASGT